MNTSEVIIEPWPSYQNIWSATIHGRRVGTIELWSRIYSFQRDHDFDRLDAYAQAKVFEATNDFIALQKLTDRMPA